MEALSIGATEDEWRSARVGLISTATINNYTELEGNQFVALINNALARDYDQFSQLQRRPLEEKASFETALTYQAVLFLEAEANIVLYCIYPFL